MFEKTEKLIKNLLKESKFIFSKEREKIELFWEKEINEKTKKNTEIVSFKNHTLIIKTKNPTWRMELFQQKEALKKKLQLKQKLK